MNATSFAILDAILDLALNMLLWQNDTEPYSFINNRLRKPSSSHLSPHSLPYALPIFRWLPVHVKWKRKKIIAFCAFLHNFLQFLKEKRSLSSFLSLLKITQLWGNEISPSPGTWGLNMLFYKNRRPPSDSMTFKVGF